MTHGNHRVAWPAVAYDYNLPDRSTEGDENVQNQGTDGVAAGRAAREASSPRVGRPSPTGGPDERGLLGQRGGHGGGGRAMKPLTEDQIESRVERMMNHLDRVFLNGDMRQGD